MRRPAILAVAILVVGTTTRAQDARPHPMKGLRLETIEWIDDGAEFLDRRRFKTTLSPEERQVDREELLATALKRSEASGKPVLWYVYKVVDKTKRGRQMIRAPILDVAMRQVVWSDDGVSRIVSSSFVPLRMVADETLVKRFDLRPLEFLEPSLVFLSPEGEVLHVLRTIRTFDADFIAAALAGVLENAHGTTEPATVADAVDRGDWEGALDLLDRDRQPDTAGHYQRAVLLRRARRGQEALAALDAAEEVWSVAVEALAGARKGRARTRFLRAARRGGGDEAATRMARLMTAIQTERGLVLMRMGRRVAAVAPLRAAADASIGERRAEAAYWLGLLRLRTGDEMDANRRFQKVAQDFPATPFGRRAHANVLLGIDDNRPIGAAFSGIERTEWLPHAVFSALPTDTRWPTDRAPLPLGDLLTRSVRFLLDQQRDDGGWNDSRYSYCPDTRITPNVWVAVSALASQALLRHRWRVPANLRDEIDDALQRSERYLADPTRLNRGRNEDVYADVYRLDFLIRRHASATERSRGGLRRQMRTIIDDAATRQRESGFWAHEYANAFCTAPMIHSLLGARACGVDVPDDLLERAGEAVATARATDGSFSYSGRARGKPRKDSLKNASTRMPVCETALHALGKSDDEQVAFAFETFWKYYDRIEGVRRTDFHSDGQVAGFMFFHALYHTITSVRTLPAAERETQYRRLLAKILTYPEIDGTFMDSHEVGRSYGTAMALLVIAEALDTTEQ